MDVFDLRRRVIGDYASYVRSFFAIRDERIRAHVDAELAAGRLWPEPLLQVSPAFEPGESLDELVAAGDLDPACRGIFGRRDIARSSDMRTVIAAAIPAVAVGSEFPLLLSDVPAPSAAALYAVLCSLVFDYAARQKVDGTSLTYLVVKQLPVPAPAALSCAAAWDATTTTVNWLASRVLELTYTSHDMVGFAKDASCTGPPFRWDPERRAILRVELDAAFFHLYGLDADDTAYILDTFPVLRDKEIRQFGEYRTRRLVLERYAALATAIATRTPYSYSSPLAPPPASLLAAHPERS